VKQTGATQNHFDPGREKPPVWIEGEFIVTSATTKPKLSARPARRPYVPRAGRRVTRGGLSTLVMRLLGVATACAAMAVLALTWAMIVG
jgi:hypothetical protein